MSQENAEVVRRNIEAFNDRDLDLLLSLTDPGAEFHSFRAQLEGTVYRGHDGLRQFVDDMYDDWSSFRIDPIEFHERGDLVVVVGRITGVSRASGVEIDSVAGFLTEVRDGRVSKVISHSDPDEALRAAGMKE